MLKVKDSEPKLSTAKRTISIDCVSIDDGVLCDENGAIAEQIEMVLPHGIDEFKIKIVIEIPEDED